MCGFVVKSQWNVLNLYFYASFQYKNYLGQEYLVNIVPKILQSVETQMFYTFVISENVKITFQSELWIENTEIGSGFLKS